MKKIFNLGAIAFAIITMTLMSACSKDDDDSITMYIYGVGNDDVEYNVELIARPNFEGPTKVFNESGRGRGVCGNLPEDIDGKVVNDSRIFVVWGIHSNWECTLRASVGEKNYFVDIPKAKGNKIWINVSPN